MANLQVIAWDHPRAIVPLQTGTRLWAEKTGHEVTLDARPLKSFEDQGLADLAGSYDLLLIDHPFVGSGSDDGLLLRVEDWVDAAELADHRTNSVGPSFAAYEWAGGHWALPIDVACQVAATRSDLMAAVDEDLPDSWDDVRGVARSLNSSTSRVAVPLNANHAYCTFLSVGVANAGEDFWPWPDPWDDDAAADALAFLKALAVNLHPISFDADPIAVSDRMAGTSEIAYVPLMFGYSTYSRGSGSEPVLTFHDAPVGASGRRGSVLGGVGAAVSAASRHPDEAASLARFLCSSDFQGSGYLEELGQPARADAWESARANALTRDFFLATRRTTEGAFIRPRVSGHRQFQPLAGQIVREVITGSLEATTALPMMRDLYDRHLVTGGPQ